MFVSSVCLHAFVRERESMSLYWRVWVCVWVCVGLFFKREWARVRVSKSSTAGVTSGVHVSRIT